MLFFVRKLFYRLLHAHLENLDDVLFIEGDKSESCFNVYRNHLYVLGEKPKDTEVKDDDKPLDLSKGLELVITIKGLWKGSNNMTI